MITIFVALIIVLGMLAAFWFGYKAGAKESLRLQSYPELEDDEEVEKEKPIEEYFGEDEE